MRNSWILIILGAALLTGCGTSTSEDKNAEKKHADLINKKDNNKPAPYPKLVKPEPPIMSISPEESN